MVPFPACRAVYCATPGDDEPILSVAGQVRCGFPGLFRRQRDVNGDRKFAISQLRVGSFVVAGDFVGGALRGVLHLSTVSANLPPVSRRRDHRPCRWLHRPCRCSSRPRPSPCPGMTCLTSFQLDNQRYRVHSYHRRPCRLTESFATGDPAAPRAATACRRRPDVSLGVGSPPRLVHRIARGVLPCLPRPSPRPLGVGGRVLGLCPRRRWRHPWPRRPCPR